MIENWQILSYFKAYQTSGSSMKEFVLWKPLYKCREKVIGKGILGPSNLQIELC